MGIAAELVVPAEHAKARGTAFQKCNTGTGQSSICPHGLRLHDTVAYETRSLTR